MGMSGMEVGSSSVLLLLIEYPRGGDRSSRLDAAGMSRRHPCGADHFMS